MIIIKNIDVYSPDYIGKKDIFIRTKSRKRKR